MSAATLLTTPFAGRDGIDEGADAFLARVPHGTALARRVGLGADLTSPDDVGRLRVAPWPPPHPRWVAPRRTRRPPPAGDQPAAQRARQAAGGRRTAAAADEAGRRLDRQVGPCTVRRRGPRTPRRRPRREHLRRRYRPLQPGHGPPARRPVQRTAQPPAGGPTKPACRTNGRRAAVLGAPRRGWSRWRWQSRQQRRRTGRHSQHRVPSRRSAPTAHGGVSTTRSPTLSCWRHQRTSPASWSPRASPPLAELLARADSASVAIVTMSVPALPSGVHGTSGYLVPKPDQRLVTAASFASQKWAHWRGTGEVVRVSLGRDGLDIDDLDDSRLADAAVVELGKHLEIDVQPTAIRVTPLAAGLPAVPAGPSRLACRRRRCDTAGVVPLRSGVPRDRSAGVHRRRRTHRRFGGQLSQLVTRRSGALRRHWSISGRQRHHSDQRAPGRQRRDAASVAAARAASADTLCGP